MKSFTRQAFYFIAIGLVLYGGVYYISEQLVYRHGSANPFFKLKTAPHATYDYVILGASHAMPFGFPGMNAYMEQASGTKILNLATPGNGIVYNRLVLDYFLETKQTAHVIYVVDSFVFYSRQWNEGRFSDVKLWRGTPWDLSLAGLLLTYVTRKEIEPTVFLDYVSGFSKINNPQRFQPDIWEGQTRFERTHRFSSTRDRKRIQYLYPSGQVDPAVFAHYLSEFSELIDQLQEKNIGFIALRTPVPTRIYEMIPHEGEFDARLRELLAQRNVPYYDFSLIGNDPQFFFDTDHLNRTGITTFVDHHLKDLLIRHARR